MSDYMEWGGLLQLGRKTVQSGGIGRWEDLFTFPGKVAFNLSKAIAPVGIADLITQIVLFAANDQGSSSLGGGIKFNMSAADGEFAAADGGYNRTVGTSCQNFLAGLDGFAPIEGNILRYYNAHKGCSIENHNHVLKKT